MKRFWVDQRLGCCAVRDHRLEEQGCPFALERVPDLVQYFPGVEVDQQCSKCGQREHYWTLPQETLLEAQALCDQLNSEQ